ncbi:MAG: polyribonucleotide nucleotidyltransferase [Candidatus Aminicenantia bacterium]
MELGGRRLSIEVGSVAKQANGSALVRYGDTVMLVTATSKEQPNEDNDFLPLIVDYRENTYAAGKIPGGFFKREGKPSEREILVSRLIDRPLRPLFLPGYNYETQIVALLLSADLENEPDALGIIGASTALLVSEIPFYTPVSAVKVGLINDEFKLNPTIEELKTSKLNMVVAGTEEGIVMIEAGAVEVDEKTIIEAIRFAHPYIKQIIELEKELFKRVNPVKRQFTSLTFNDEKLNELRERIRARLLIAIRTSQKKEREKNIDEILQELLSEVPEEEKEKRIEIERYFNELKKRIFREDVLINRRRPDGREFKEIRPITIKVGHLPRTHGSSLFTRGETQALVTATLGTFEDVQRLDILEDENAVKRFMVHYNFPPFCVGEVSFLRGPGRREIGHGALAERALVPAIPDEDVFPYTIRIVSDILESNGSSSMATVCGATLALMDAGVPLKMIVAGIAMGLIIENENWVTLTDIAGLEDHYGDMDFKVAGTKNGITALQMDIKVKNISFEIIESALMQAKEARLEVLEKMLSVIPEPRKEISPYAPRIGMIEINPDKIKDLIGPAGKTIKGIIEKTGTKINIENNGKVTVAAPDPKSMEEAIRLIKEIIMVEEVEVGKVYTGKVKRIEEYGAFLEIRPNVVGLLHISEIANYRIRNVRDVIKEGQELEVKVIDIDEFGRIKLSRKALQAASSQSHRPRMPYERERQEKRKKTPSPF